MEISLFLIRKVNGLFYISALLHARAHRLSGRSPTTDGMPSSLTTNSSTASHSARFAPIPSPPFNPCSVAAISLPFSLPLLPSQRQSQTTPTKSKFLAINRVLLGCRSLGRLLVAGCALLSSPHFASQSGADDIPINQLEHAQHAHSKLTTCILGDKINLHRAALVYQPLTFLGIEQR